jgi:hypothetical protein
MADFQVTRLLQNPLGQEAPPGHRGDIVRVSTRWATVYMDPVEFDRATENELEAMLAQADKRSNLGPRCNHIETQGTKHDRAVRT